MTGMTIVYGIIHLLTIFVLLKGFSKKLFHISDDEKKLYTNEITHLKGMDFVDSFYKFYL